MGLQNTFMTVSFMIFLILMIIFVIILVLSRKIMNFQTTTLSIALVIFILTFLILVVQLYQYNVSFVWPPETADCPDLWLSGTDSNKKTYCQPNNMLTTETGNWGGQCYENDKGIYVCSSMNFDVAPYNSKDKIQAISAKCNWATNHNIYWAGITDVNSSCDGIPPINNLNDS
jgi:hypothetical protein